MKIIQDNFNESKVFDACQLKKVYEDLKIKTHLNSPITAYVANDGAVCVLDGIKRVSCAIHLQWPTIDVEFLPQLNTLKRMIDNPSLTFGTPNGQPYQPIMCNKNIYIPGQRTELIQRLNLMKKEVSFKDKSVIDLGGNYGTNARLIYEEGAKIVHLCDLPQMLYSNVQLGIFFNDTNVQYWPINLEHDLSHLPVCDIAFCFSITKWVKKHDNLLTYLRTRVKSFLFYETHEDATMEPTIKSLFKSVKHLGGYNGRNLFICYK